MDPHPLLPSSGGLPGVRKEGWFPGQRRLSPHWGQQVEGQCVAGSQAGLGPEVIEGFPATPPALWRRPLGGYHEFPSSCFLGT